MSYAIHCDPCYYAGTLNVSTPGLVTPWGDLKAITLADHADAQKLCDMLNDTGDQPYMLSHGQYAAPNHTVVERENLPVRYALKDAMSALGLHDDFDLSGARKEWWKE